MRMLPRVMAAITAAPRAQNLVSSFVDDLSDAKALDLSEILYGFNKKILEKLK
jgi:hypothetical protein